MLDAIALILPLLLLVGLAYLGGAVLVLAPLCAALAAGLSAQPILAVLTERFAPAMGGFVMGYLFIFVLGAIFGKLVEESGGARRLADAIVRLAGPERAIVAVTGACALLTYGGVSLFVVAFAVYPLARALFRQGDVSERLIPATIALGAFTFTMTALPGTPSIQNAIPMPYFGTTSFAAPGMGLLAAVIMAVTGLIYLNWAARRSSEAVLLTGELPRAIPEVGPGVADSDAPRRAPGLPLMAALLPIFVLLTTNYVLSTQVFPRADLSFLPEPPWETDPASVVGLWSLIVALVAGIATLLAVAQGQRRMLVTDAVGPGAEAALLPLMNTAVLVGFGATVAALPAFESLRGALATIPGGTLVQVALTVSILAGVTGSASGGMSIALETLADPFKEMASADGTSAEELHRVTVLATGGLDALPHNGAVVTLLGIGKLTHREAYGPIFIVAVACPVLALLAVLGVAYVS